MKLNYYSKYFIISISIIALNIFFSCKEKYSNEEKIYIEQIKNLREQKNNYMKQDPASPFNYDAKAKFKPLKYFDVNLAFVFKSKLYEYGTKDTIEILGTKDENGTFSSESADSDGVCDRKAKRIAIKFGFINFNYEGKIYKINVYKNLSENKEVYYSIWFTDKTTGNETYGVGRYLDFELNNDKNFIYTIDFNLAYNPYCSYSSLYSCAIPTKDDYINLEIKAGEKNFH